MSANLDRLPRVRLANLPTPLQEATRLRAALGGPAKAPRILIKRDDLTGLAYGGNKVRKLEYLVADALAQGATDLITAGAAQSNHCRATVAAGLLHGLRTTLVLDTTNPHQQPQGNLLLDRLMGAHIDFVAPETDKLVHMAELASKMKSEGRTPYVIPVGGSNAIGTVGYLTMAQELSTQLPALDAVPDYVYFANGSRGTQAGIVLGMRLFAVPGTARGILISGNSPEREQHALDIANGAAELIGSEVRLTPNDLRNVDGFVGEGYAIPTESGDAAIELLARTEAVFLDPVYTGKAMGALIEHIRTGQITPDQTVVFIHTGGNPSIFAHAERLAARARLE